MEDIKASKSASSRRGPRSPYDPSSTATQRGIGFILLLPDSSADESCNVKWDSFFDWSAKAKRGSVSGDLQARCKAIATGLTMVQA